MTIQTRLIDYSHDGVALQGELAWDDAGGPKPVVLVVSTWAGRTEFEGSKAKMLAELGYVGFAVDMFGKGVVGDSVEACSAMIEPLLGDRALLQARMAAGLEAASGQPEVAAGPSAAIGFCFGGLSVLDLARTGAHVAGVVSFHGLLGPADNIPEPSISAKVLVLHGYDDPMATPDAVLAFADEMGRAGADWQVHAYGGTYHAFTNPEANNPEMGTIYNATAEARSFASMRAFLAEVLPG
ncbi:dienelactone hydrolase family protein [Luminiphilus syltensis NOR5-1B]|uniref:Dienelactone hydrolase family protein n=1 Tax=Luminiphilus syltensis NOR5-1B TaxID=565045 RepID=B8KYC4_9GAMM|nr:dienelactone hydrolase family protein [Luminiphilus syltensis]EED36367.1 dienelactone hydrolase family protein [Luminiphilus syltensis NOR5-1B]